MKVSISATVSALIALQSMTSDAFVIPTSRTSTLTQTTAASSASASASMIARYSTPADETATSAFLPLDANDDNDDDDDDDEVDIDTVESLGRGAAKTKRGKRKGGVASASSNAAKKAAVTLTPEETFYEGPPAITETLVPTLSILTIIGIIPAAAAWARQAWVRYKITSRRIRVTSGLNGQDMAEIVYPDVVEIRTVKRLFGDGDMVLFLRDGAKFELRNIPEFESALEFILKQCDESVVAAYRKVGDVSKS